MTEDTLEIPIGPNCSLDGGPYFAAEGQGTDHPDTDVVTGVVALVDQEGNEFTATIEEIERHVVEEMERDEPVRVNTGDVGDEYDVGTIEVPLVGGFYVAPFTLGEERSYLLPDLEGDKYLMLSATERKLAHSGGILSPING